MNRDKIEEVDGGRSTVGVPASGFRTILADPPWPAQGGERHYRTMSLERIKGLPVADLAASDTHLWL